MNPAEGLGRKLGVTVAGVLLMNALMGAIAPANVSAQGETPPAPTPITEPLRKPVSEPVAIGSKSVSVAEMLDAQPIQSEIPISQTVVLPNITVPTDRPLTYRTLPDDRNSSTKNTMNIRSLPNGLIVSTMAEGDSLQVVPGILPEKAGGHEWFPVYKDGAIRYVSELTTPVTETVPIPLPQSVVTVDSLLAPFAQIGGSEESYPPAVADFLEAQRSGTVFDAVTALAKAQQAEPEFVAAFNIPKDFKSVAASAVITDHSISEGFGFPIGTVIQKGSQVVLNGALRVGVDDLFMADITSRQIPGSKTLPQASSALLSRAQLETMYSQEETDAMVQQLTYVTGPDFVDTALNATGVTRIENKDGTFTTVPFLTHGEIEVNTGANVTYSQAEDGFFGMVYDPQGKLAGEYEWNGGWKKVEQPTLTVGDRILDLVYDEQLGTEIWYEDGNPAYMVERVTGELVSIAKRGRLAVFMDIDYGVRIDLNSASTERIELMLTKWEERREITEPIDRYELFYLQAQDFSHDDYPGQHVPVVTSPGNSTGYAPYAEPFTYSDTETGEEKRGMRLYYYTGPNVRPTTNPESLLGMNLALHDQAQGASIPEWYSYPESKGLGSTLFVLPDIVNN